MGDHLYENVMDYAECELIPRFQDECSQYQRFTDCPSYEEMKDFCNVLNIIGKYCGMSKLFLSDFIPDDYKI